MYVEIEFPSNGGLKVRSGVIDQGLMVIPTTDNKYVLVSFTIDGDFVEIYDSFRELIKKLKEYYGDDIAKIVENELKEYYGNDIAEDENEIIQN